MEEKWSGIVVVGIYFPYYKDYFVNDCRIFLKESIPKALKKNAEKIEPLDFGILRYVPSFEKKAKEKGKTKGVLYIYYVKGASSNFFKKLKKILEEKKKKDLKEGFSNAKNKKGKEYIQSYYIIYGNYVG